MEPWKRLIPGRLMIKFYLWFLFALTLTVATTAGVLTLISFGGFEERIRERVLAEVRLGRDIAEYLLRTSTDLGKLRALLAPLAADGRLRLVITGKHGRRVLELSEPGSSAGPELSALSEVAREALARGHWIDFHRRGWLAAALPLNLPSGETGLFYVSVQMRRWQHDRQPFRLLVGVGAVLVLGWVLCWPLAARLTRPLRQMVAVADALGAGDLAARIHLERKDEIGKLAQSFNSMAGSVEQLLARHKQLLADISHEFRSPLSRLRVALELARQEDRAGGREYLDVVEKQADAIDGMIEELLTYSRLEAIPHQLRTEVLSPGEIVDEAADDIRSEADAKGISIDISGGGEPGTINGDRRLLVRALGNVLRNAVAYAPQGKPIAVTLTRGGGRLTFAVSDSGPGVEPEILEQIFQPFFRAGSARMRGSSGGVGLGLAIARRCMEAHGGGAAAESAREGTGLTVKLWLPFAE